jgi:ABC-2 type transport system ATP-binding protein
MVLLEFKDIKKRFGKREVLKGVSFKIFPGEIIGLIGKSGCGKTTLLKILMGLSKQDEGTIIFENKSINSEKNYLRKKTGFAAQESTLFPDLTLKENAFFFGKLYGIHKQELNAKFNELVSFLSLKGFEDFLVKKLSGGMKKRANLLVSLIHNPQLLILDEPTGGLDSLLRKNLWDYILKINREGTTIIIISHLLEEIEKNCSRVAILDEGKIKSFASIREYKNYYRSKRNLNEIFHEVVK